jgi:hypothetical protein
MKRAIPSLLAVAMLVGFGVRTAAAQEEVKPLAVSHDLEGRDNCLMCHKTGVMEAPVAPESHVDRTNEVCLLCHGPDAPMQTADAAAVAHDLEGRDNCLMCHKTGVMEAPVAPENHAEIANEHCTMCHKPAG